MGFLGSHQGSWLGLPDFGLTEAVGGLFNRPQTYQGGSNIVGSQPQPKAQTGQVLSGSTYNANQYSSPIGPTYSGPQTNKNLSGGGSPNPQDTFDQARDNATNTDQANLNRLLSQYDYNAERLQNQKGYLQTQKDDAFAQLGLEEEKLQTTVSGQKEESKSTISREIEEAANVANEVKRQNRNILRALGILSSTAAAEMLQNPANEFAKERGRLVELGVKRINELDDYLNQGLREIGNARTSVQNQFTNLVANIDADLRFNDRERASAIEQANAALNERLLQIDMAAIDFAKQTQMAQNSTLQQLNTITQYQQPGAQTEGISSSVITPQQLSSPQQVGLTGEDEDRRRTLSGLA